MQKLILFKVSDKLYAIDQKFVKKKYLNEELFDARIKKARKVKVKLDGQDIPLFDLTAIFGGSGVVVEKNNSEAMLVKDEEGHMLLLADQIEGVFETEKELIEDLSPVFGKRSCSCFPKVFAKDGLAVLVLNPSGIRVESGLIMGSS